MNTLTDVSNFPVRFFTDSCKADNEYHRLVVIRWKERKDTTTGKTIPAKAARCVSIPRIPIMVEPAPLTLALQDAFEELQKKAITEIIEEAIANNDASPYISASDITPEAVASYFSRIATSGRLSNEAIKSWFDASLSDTLTLAIANALKVSDTPTQMEADKINAHVNEYRSAIVALASPRASLPIKVATQLKSVIAKATPDEMTAKLNAKLDAFLTPKEYSIGLDL